MVSKATGCKNSYSLMRLSTHDRTSQTSPDAMHTVTDVTEKLVYLIIGKLGRPHICNSVKVICTFLGKTNAKLNGKITRAEGNLTRFGLQPNSAEADVPWQLSTTDLRLAINRLRHIVVPSHLDFKAQNVFTNPSRLKSHDWKQVNNFN